MIDITFNCVFRICQVVATPDYTFEIYRNGMLVFENQDDWWINKGRKFPPIQYI